VGSREASKGKQGGVQGRCPGEQEQEQEQEQELGPYSASGFGDMIWWNHPNRADLISLRSLCHLQGSSRHGGVPDTRGSLRAAQQAPPPEAGLSIMTKISIMTEIEIFGAAASQGINQSCWRVCMSECYGAGPDLVQVHIHCVWDVCIAQLPTCYRCRLLGPRPEATV
jgi:hypothetical protein